MEVKNVKPMDGTGVVTLSTLASQQGVDGGIDRGEQPKADTAEKLPKQLEDLLPITEQMNKLMQLLNADIEFSVHEKTKRLILRVVDKSSMKVLKEFPPHELLDTLGKINEYVGVLLDKRA